MQEENTVEGRLRRPPSTCVRIVLQAISCLHSILRLIYPLYFSIYGTASNISLRHNCNTCPMGTAVEGIRAVAFRAQHAQMVVHHSSFGEYARNPGHHLYFHRREKEKRATGRNGIKSATVFTNTKIPSLRLFAMRCTLSVVCGMLPVDMEESHSGLVHRS